MQENIQQIIDYEGNNRKNKNILNKTGLICYRNNVSSLSLNTSMGKIDKHY